MAKWVKIRNVKGIQSLDYLIPDAGVHLLAGSNGSGKTTLLACLRRLCHPNAFQLHFTRSFQSDRLDVFDDANVIYEYNDESVTYAYAGERWVPRPRRSSRLVERFGYPDVLYIGATASRITPRQEYFKASNIKSVPETIFKAANAIFTTERFSDLRTINITTGNRNQAFVLIDRRPGQKISYFSEKNFSLGELCVLKLLRELNNCKNGTLVLIDELELALHPRAQVGLIDHLEALAKEKSLTVIVSTHSVTLLKKTPRSKITFLEKGENGETNVLRNCFPAYALGGISVTEERLPDIVIYVEDEAARTVTENFVRLFIHEKYPNPSFAYPSVRVLPVGDYNNVVRFFKGNRPILPDHVKQWVLLDQDVEAEVVEKMDASSNNPMRDAFHECSDRIRYLPFTPEVALIEYLSKNPTKMQNLLRAKYFNNSMTLPQQLVSISASVGSERRKECKRLLRNVIEHIQKETTNLSEEKVNDFLYQTFTSSYFKEDRETVMQVLGPIINSN